MENDSIVKNKKIDLEEIKSEKKEEQIKEIKLAIKKVREKFFPFVSIILKIDLIYLAVYVCWFLLHGSIIELINWLTGRKSDQINLMETPWWLIISQVTLQGALSLVDSKVTALFKVPVSQVCHYINVCKEIKDKEKEKLISYVTEASEFNRDVVKRFGVLTLVSEVEGVLLRSEPIPRQRKDFGTAKSIAISYAAYFVPIFFSFKSLYSFHKLLGEIEEKRISELNRKDQEINNNSNLSLLENNK